MTNQGSLKLNVIANYLGNSWNVLMNIAFIPVYIKYLGMESYGLIGFYAMVQSALMLLDGGITPTLNREMARFTAGKHSSETIMNLLRTLEILCFTIAFTYSILIWWSSGWTAEYWFKARTLSVKEISESFALIGLVASLRLIEGLYRGAILGLQKHVVLNIVTAIMATLRSGGAALILIYVASSIQAYFFWQAFVSFLAVFIFFVITYSSLPDSWLKGKFSLPELKKIWHFAIGVMATSLFALLITQIDKLMLSKILSLEKFGNYSLVVTITNVLLMLVGPISQAYYPRFSELIGKKDVDRLNQTFHEGAQLAGVISSCGFLGLLVFGDRIVDLWTGSEVLANEIFYLLRLMSFGTFLNCCWNILYTAQLSFGWSSFAAKMNFIGCLIFVPGIIVITPVYGASGAAWLWLLLNLGHVFIASHFMFKKILQGEKKKWLIQDLLLPALSAFVTFVIFFKICPKKLSNIYEILYISFSGFFAFIISLFVAKDLRAFIMTFLFSKIKPDNS